MSLSYIKENTERIRERIRQAERLAGRPEGSVQMIAAVKYAQPEELAALCSETEIRDLGENRVQQLLSHYESLPNPGDYRWHFIGSLQTNKVKYLIDKVCMIHSLDSLRLAEEIEKQAAKRGIIMDVLVEINSGEEESKGGLMPHETEEFCLSLRQFSHLNHRGFMTMAPKCDEKSEYLKYFQQTYQQVLDIWTKKLHNIGRPILSMGMSESFEEAIACGSDMVRVGRGLFVRESEEGKNK